MIVRSEGAARALRHVSMTSNGRGMPAIGPLGAELRRAMAMSRTNGTGATREMLLLDGVGLEPGQVAELSDRAGVQMRAGDELKLLGVTPDAAATARVGGEASQPLAAFMPAVSL